MGFVLSTLRARQKLKAVPGPKIAKWTQWWLRGREHLIEDAHRKYGSIVQVGPKALSVNDGQCLRDIYAVSRKLNRPDPLPQFHLYSSPNLVSTVDGDLHQQRRKPVRTLYSKKAVDSSSIQDLLATTMQRLNTTITGSIRDSASIDFRPPIRWMLCDIMSHIIYGHKHALNTLEDPEQRKLMNVDFEWQDDKSIRLDLLMSAFCPSLLVSLRQWHIMDPRFPENLHMRKIAQAAVDGLLQGRHADETLLKRLLDQYQNTGPSDALPDLNYILSECLDHFWAGVGTTTDALSALVYELSLPVNRDRQIRLRDELMQPDRHTNSQSIESSKSKAPKYLDCVIRESLRLYPPIAVTLERLVTNREGSIDVAGHIVPAGTTVGAQAFSVHRNPAAFPNAESWLPERWEAESGSEQHSLQRRHFFAFGAGPRMCIGMNVAESVMRHAVTSIYRNFETGLGPEWFDENNELLEKSLRTKKGLWPQWLGGGLVPLHVRQL